MNRRTFLLGTSTLLTAGCGGVSGPRLTLVSYDATRELFREVNRRFSAWHDRKFGAPVRVFASHGGSTKQALAVLNGLPAEVVSLAIRSDMDVLCRDGLIDAGWEKRFPNRSLPFTSAIVFVVRKGNPHGIVEWPDLVTKPGVKIITASPKTSGVAKLAFLAAWGSVTASGGSDADAERYVGELFRRVPVLESGSRAATNTFARKCLGDVTLTWENEARLEMREFGDALEIVYPKRSIRGEPHVAVVDATAKRNGTEGLAESFVKFLYEDDVQDVIAQNYYRPTAPAALARYADRFGAVQLFGIDDVVPGGWDEAQRRFFADGGVFDRIYAS
ncbi:MAG TPA: sulfate ABC transporter substrate-binding protein [Fimbriiglobus sp.]|jgi:sulfate transport system substrate-binding protein